MKISILTCSLIVSSIYTNASQAATYYLDRSHANSKDSNAGTSPEAPWMSLSRVASQRLVAGDVVRIKKGTVYSGSLNLSASGSAGNPITLSSYGEGVRPVLKNSGSMSHVIYLNGSYNVIEGIAFQDAVYAGVLIGSSGQQNTVRDCEFVSVGQGVVIEGSNNLITQNTAHDLKMVVNTSGGDDDYGATGFNVQGMNNEVSYNSCVRCQAPSYDYGSDGSLVELYGVVDGAYIHHNYAEATAAFFEIGGQSGDTARNVRVSQNLSYNIGGAFAVVHNSGNFGVTVQNLRIENNTIIEHKYESQLGWTLIWTSGNPNGSVSFRNNVVSIRDLGQVFQFASVVRSDNIYQFLNPRTRLTFDNGSLSTRERMADPMFVNASAANFRLQANSPAVNAGSDLGFTADMDGNPIPVGGAPDLGAYEYQGGTVNPSPSPSPTVTVTPSPSPSPTVTVTPSPSPSVTPSPSPTAPPSTSNLINNSGFESGSLSGWINWGNARVAREQARSGAYAMKVGNNEGGGGYRVAHVSGAKYVLSVSAKLTNSWEKAWVGVQFLNSSTQVIGKTQMTFSGQSYSAKSMNFSPPSGTTTVEVFVWKESSRGYLYLDDLSLTR